MDLHRLRAVLFGRRAVIAACCIACVLAALLYGAVAPRRYLATAYLVVGGPTTVGSAGATSVSTQAEIVTNPRVIRRAMEQLEREQVVAPADSENELDRREKLVARNLTVTPPRDSNVVQLNYTASDPAVAAATANALANAYLDVSADLRKEPVRKELAAVQQQMNFLQVQANDARSELAAFKKKSGLVMSDERMDVEQATLNELIRRSVESRGRQMDRGDGGAVVGVLQGPMLQSLQVAVLQARTKLSEMAERYGPNHPDYLQAQSALRDAQDRLATETRRSTTIAAAPRSTGDAGGALSGAVERQKTLVRNMAGDREQLAYLQRDADEATRSLQLMKDRLTQAQLDNARAIDSGVLMTPARTPQDAVSLGIVKVLPLAAVLGLFVGIFGVIVWEQLTPRVRQADDLLAHTGTEVLASVPMTRRLPGRRTEEPAHLTTFRDRTLSSTSAAARPLGNLLVAFGAMTLLDAESVVVAQKRSGTSFGATAVSMGLISDMQLTKALSVQYGRPRVMPSSQAPSPSLFVDQEPDHPIAEAVRALRSQLLLRPVGQRPGTMTITSINEHDGRTFVATNLAIAFSQIGKRVLLIDGNLRSPSMDQLFHLKNERGLSGYLAHRHGAPKIHELGTRGNLGVMLAGPIPPNPQELLSSPLLAILLHSLRSVFELIVIDTPAATLGTDAQLLSARAGSTILVSRLHVTALDEVGSLSRTFTRQGVNVIGTIVNEA